MVDMPEIAVRLARLDDAPALAILERAHFPARAGEPHGGYVYGNPEITSQLLDEEVARGTRVATLVAEASGEIAGFATVRPWSLPGARGNSPSDILLQYLAVDPPFRRAGVATALVEEIERRCLADRQDVIVAHIPTSAVDFYRALGWEVVPEERGFAWLPFMHFMRADIGDPGFGFPLMAAKVLRPRAIRHAFDFPVRGDRPVADASLELLSIIDEGTIDFHDLDETTRAFIGIAREGMSPQQMDARLRAMGTQR